MRYRLASPQTVITVPTASSHHALPGLKSPSSPFGVFPLLAWMMANPLPAISASPIASNMSTRSRSRSKMSRASFTGETLASTRVRRSAVRGPAPSDPLAYNRWEEDDADLYRPRRATG